jgi:hypothetical protein
MQTVKVKIMFVVVTFEHYFMVHGSLVIAIKPKPKHTFQSDTILLFYILQKITQQNLRFEDLYHTSSEDLF